MIDQNEYLLTRKDGSGLRAKNIQWKEAKQRRWLRKIQCFFFGHWWAIHPGSLEDQNVIAYFCERGCGK